MYQSSYILLYFVSSYLSLYLCHLVINYMCDKTQSLYIMKYNIKLKMITTMTQKQLVEIFRNGRWCVILWWLSWTFEMRCSRWGLNLLIIRCTMAILPRSRNNWTLLSLVLNLYKNEVIKVRKMKKIKLPIQLPMTEKAFFQWIYGLIILVVGFIIVMVLTTPTGWVWVLLNHIIKVWRSLMVFWLYFPISFSNPPKIWCLP